MKIKTKDTTDTAGVAITPEPIAAPSLDLLPQNDARAFDLSPTDAANDERGAPREGEIIPEPMVFSAPPVIWGIPEDAPLPGLPLAKGKEIERLDVDIPLDTTSPDPYSDTKMDYPDGWIKDTNGDLWPYGAIDGIRVNTLDCDGVWYRVQALTPEGWRTIDQQRNKQDMIFTQYSLAYRISMPKPEF